MKAAFYSGASGLMAQQAAMDAIGNNVANLSTNGYKEERISFRSLLYQQMYANTETDPLTGYGVRPVSLGLDFTEGDLRQTNYPLDYAIAGSGLFAVQQGGKVQYTRDGAFTISMENGVPYLATADGAYVLDQGLQKIQVTYTAKDVVDTEAIRQKLGLFTFRNPAGLEAVSNNRYVATDWSGPVQPLANGTQTILSGVLEGSGVSAVDQMADMITTQRAYQLSAKVLTTADENEQTVNSLRK